MEHVVISGGTGLVGHFLIPLLQERHYKVTILSRSKEGDKNGIQYVKWNPDQNELDKEIIQQADHIINLAGANLFDKRWTASYKEEIINSRVLSTRLLVDTINAEAPNLKTFVSASAINYYGLKRKGVLEEDHVPGDHFLSEVCIHWENEAHKLNQPSTRLFIPRIATILAPKEGALEQMTKPIRFGVGAPLGSGEQQTPWIHIKDLVKMILEGLQNSEMKGPFNAAAPEVVTNKAMTQMIAKKLGKPLFLPNIPIFALKLGIGEFAEVLLTDLEVSVEKAVNAGFEFDFPTMDEALEDLLS